MNTRSLRFQLITWYAGLLLGAFGIIGVATYLALQDSLTGALKETQLRRARQIGHLLLEGLRDPAVRGGDRLEKEIEESFAPGQNNRFIRITALDGTKLYTSQLRPGTSFDPVRIAAPQWPAGPEAARTVALPEGRAMILTAHKVQGPRGEAYLVETGAPLDGVRADLRKWLLFLGAMLPVLAVIALGGGYLLIKRALSSVDKISATAERISSHNLGERLPVAQTGDELERLSVALNRMIHRLDASFQHSRRFVADASHELRTPLTVLRGELEFFVYESKLPAEWRERLGSALEEVVRLSHIVEGLFAISRLDAGEAAAGWVKFDLAQLVASTVDQMSLLAEDKNIRLACSTSHGVWVEGDRSRLKQVVVNLLDNAIKYTPARGTVTLAVSAQGNQAVLEVTDTGIGIPPEALPRVFERFFRVDTARSREQGGAGLGLSIVKSICTAHQGRVEAASTPGEGSRFRVELPLIAVPASKHKQENREH
jgi:two-component system OmpR family sensor kinase